MKQITEKYYALDVEDLEKAVSTFFGKAVTVGEMECEIEYFQSTQTDGPIDPVLYIVCGNGSDFASSFDLFLDEKSGQLHTLNGHLLALEMPCHTTDQIFNFATSLFKRFEIRIEPAN